MTYRITPKAESDLDEIAEYIAADDPLAAVELIEDIRQRFRILGDNPRLGRSRPEIAKGVRTFPVGNYLILHRLVKGGGVEIVRVVHGARHLPQIKL